MDGLTTRQLQASQMLHFCTFWSAAVSIGQLSIIKDHESSYIDKINIAGFTLARNLERSPSHLIRIWIIFIPIVCNEWLHVRFKWKMFGGWKNSIQPASFVSFTWTCECRACDIDKISWIWDVKSLEKSCEERGTVTCNNGTMPSSNYANAQTDKTENWPNLVYRQCHEKIGTSSGRPQTSQTM